MAGEKFLIHGGMRLKGQIAVSGGKNAAVAIIPAALLGSSPSVIETCLILKMYVLIEEVARPGREGGIQRFRHARVDPTTVDKAAPSPGAPGAKMRASYYLAPVLLGIFMRGSAHAWRRQHRDPRHRPKPSRV